MAYALMWVTPEAQGSTIGNGSRVRQGGDMDYAEIAPVVKYLAFAALLIAVFIVVDFLNHKKEKMPKKVKMLKEEKMADDKARRKFPALKSLFFWSAIIFSIKVIDHLLVETDLTLYGAVCMWAVVAWAAVRWEIKHWS